MNAATAHILLPLPFDHGFDYRLPEGGQAIPGRWVTVPFGSREIHGVIWGEGRDNLPEAKLRDIADWPDYPPLPQACRDFLQWVAAYTMAPLGAVLKMAMSVPEALDTRTSRQRARPEGVVAGKELPALPFALSQAQIAAAEAISASVTKHEFKPFLLDGVTGSGKTEVYFEAIRAAVNGGGQVAILLPEIALGAQWLERFEARFGVAPALWHSQVARARKREIWRGVLAGEVQVVVGARSALFLPFSKLACLILDEEHDASYKQEEQVIYHARDMAIVRAREEHCPVVLVSATPSLETWRNVQSGKYERLHLPARATGASLPEIGVIDLREDKPERQSWLSPTMKSAMVETLASGEQVLLYLNRRGYAPLTLCRHCGHRFQCPACDSWLVQHHPVNRPPNLQCHHCGYRTPYPEECPECHEHDSLAACGPGVERIAEEVRALFPQAETAILASDTAENMAEVQEIIDRMTAGRTDILIGTQMATKGHHFPHLTLVGVVDADIGLMGGDLRAHERTYQLLHQVAGRAGREDRPGRALIQTYDPKHPFIQALAADDRDGFLAYELSLREHTGMPPSGRLAAILMTGRNESKVREIARNLARAAPHDPDIQVLGPVPAPLTRLRHEYRYRLLIKAPEERRLQPYLHQWIGAFPLPKTIKLRIDIDPYHFL